MLRRILKSKLPTITPMNEWGFMAICLPTPQTILKSTPNNQIYIPYD